MARLSYGSNWMCLFVSPAPWQEDFHSMNANKDRPPSSEMCTCNNADFAMRRCRHVFSRAWSCPRGTNRSLDNPANSSRVSWLTSRDSLDRVGLVLLREVQAA